MLKTILQPRSRPGRWLSERTIFNPPRGAIDQRNRTSVMILALVVCAGISHAADTASVPALKPGELVDYGPLAFKPEVWKAKGQSTMLLPWAAATLSSSLQRALREVGQIPTAKRVSKLQFRSGWRVTLRCCVHIVLYRSPGRTGCRTCNCGRRRFAQSGGPQLACPDLGRAGVDFN